jgi:hypothetical protein
MLGPVDPAEVWRERVEDVLTVELGLLAHRGLEPEASGFLGPGPHVPPDGRGAIDALTGIGLLGEDDAARWRFVPAPAPAATWLDVLRDGTLIVRIPLT